MTSKHKKRIGIYAGTFDPVHTGHIAFALQAVEVAKLDEVYFLPERQPRQKQGVEHLAHRIAMLERASRPYKRFHVLEMPDINFSIERTLPRLERLFNGKQLVFLFGSDIVSNITSWPKASRLLKECELVIGLRSQDDQEKIKQAISDWPLQPADLIIFNSYAPNVSSGSVREALRKNQSTSGLLRSVQRYSDHHWLYVSFG